MKLRNLPMHRGQQKGRGKRCIVPVQIGKFVAPCNDRATKAGRCAEHFADWKHAKEARRLSPPSLEPMRIPARGTIRRAGREIDHSDARLLAANVKRVRKAARRLSEVAA